MGMGELINELVRLAGAKTYSAEYPEGFWERNIKPVLDRKAAIIKEVGKREAKLNKLYDQINTND